ncbi:hypothetical protein [Alistipes communis]|uniref:hypothetical protein n=1 Tax=Alistipes communis TaxID=2585118 RepID=UPI003A8387F7
MIELIAAPLSTGVSRRRRTSPSEGSSSLRKASSRKSNARVGLPSRLRLCVSTTSTTTSRFEGSTSHFETPSE